jgi:hypothetical protein
MPDSVVGSGPVELTLSTGQFVSIPLSALYFDTDGTLKADNWPPLKNYPGGDQEVIKSWLAHLVTNNLVTKLVAAPPKPAMVVKATDPGSAGNSVQVQTKVTKVDPDPTKTTFDITITETDTYTGLSAATIKNVLGTEKAPGSGLVHVVDASVKPGLVPDQAKSPYKLPAPGAPGAAPRVDVVDASNAVVFTLEAKKPGPDGKGTTVTITNVDTNAKTFALTATWTKKTATGVTVATLQQGTAGLGLGYEVNIAPPTGVTYSVPKDGTVTLTGGYDGTPPANASATIFAG